MHHSIIFVFPSVWSNAYWLLIYLQVCYDLAMSIVCFVFWIVVLALITLALFLGFERLQTITAYGYSFWAFVAGTCCVFVSCILTAVYRIDVEFEFRRYRHESVATLCWNMISLAFVFLWYIIDKNLIFVSFTCISRASNKSTSVFDFLFFVFLFVILRDVNRTERKQM